MTNETRPAPATNIVKVCTSCADDETIILDEIEIDAEDGQAYVHVLADFDGDCDYCANS